jgi:hypothetical protein
MSDHAIYFFHSGDTDAVVPVTATRYSISALKLPTLMNWYPWYDHGKVGLLKGLSLNRENSGWERTIFSLILSTPLCFAGWGLESGLQRTNPRDRSRCRAWGASAPASTSVNNIQTFFEGHTNAISIAARSKTIANHESHIHCFFFYILLRLILLLQHVIQLSLLNCMYVS